MLRKLSQFLPLLAVFAAFPYGVASGCEVIKAAYSGIWVPVSYDTHTQKTLGVGPAVKREISNRLNLPVKFMIGIPWKRQIELLKSGQLDTIIALHFNSDRGRDFQFTDPYYESRVRLFMRVDRKVDYAQPSDLIGLKGLAAHGASFGDEFDTFAREKLTIDRMRDYGRMADLVYNQRFDYLIMPEQLAEHNIRKRGYEGQIISIGDPVATKPIHMAFSRKSKCQKMISKINQALADLKKDGTMDRIVKSSLSEAYQNQ